MPSCLPPCTSAVANGPAAESTIAVAPSISPITAARRVRRGRSPMRFATP